MNALWRGHPATAREIGERLPREVGWAYTTLKTLLSRLAAKSVVSEEKRGNTSLYSPLVSRSQARRAALGSLLDQAFDGAVAPLLRFVVHDRTLSDRQRRDLIRILERDDDAPGETK
jgi:predicted transcriptional regulator